MNIHGITRTEIQTLTEKLNDNVMFPQDMRCENIKCKKKLWARRSAAGASKESYTFCFRRRKLSKT